MSDKYPMGLSSPEEIRSEIWKQMLKGGFAAAAVVIGPGVFIYVLYLIGTLLPPESKEAADPTPDSFSSVLIAPEETRLG